MLPYLRATEHGELCQEDVVKVVVLKELDLVYVHIFQTYETVQPEV